MRDPRLKDFRAKFWVFTDPRTSPGILSLAASIPSQVRTACQLVE